MRHLMIQIADVITELKEEVDWSSSDRWWFDSCERWNAWLSFFFLFLFCVLFFGEQQFSYMSCQICSQLESCRESFWWKLMVFIKIKMVLLHCQHKKCKGKILKVGYVAHDLGTIDLKTVFVTFGEAIKTVFHCRTSILYDQNIHFSPC